MRLVESFSLVSWNPKSLWRSLGELILCGPVILDQSSCTASRGEPNPGGGLYVVAGRHPGTGYGPRTTPSQPFCSCPDGVRPPEEDDPRHRCDKKWAKMTHLEIILTLKLTGRPLGGGTVADYLWLRPHPGRFLIISVKSASITKFFMKSFYANSNLTLKLCIIMSLYCCL